MKDTINKIEISHRTIIFTVFFLIGMYFLFLIRDIIAVIFISILFVAALNPLITLLEKFKVPRGLSIIIVYFLIIGAIVSAIASIVPPLINQSINLITQIPLPDILPQLIDNANFRLQDLQVIADQLNSVPKVINIIISAFSVFIIIITILVLSIYMIQERKNLHRHLVWLFGDGGAEKKAENFVNKIEHQLGSWVRGEVALMFIVGLLTYIGLTLLNIPFALPLAIIAGLLEIIPNIGPTISAVPAIIVAYVAVSPAMALAVLALYVLVQQLENNFIVPVVMRQAIGMSPIVTIILLLIGFRLGGIAGAALSLPLFLVTKISLEEFASRKKK
jgi:predicted PurR-regulated permease PerM